MFNTENPDGATLAGLTYTDKFGTWRKSQRSGPNGQCVEVTTLSDGSIAFRNSKNRDGGTAVFTTAEIAAFHEGVKDGEFDYLA
jgi:hypothetical protein